MPEHTDSELLSKWRVEFNDGWDTTAEQRDDCNEDIRFVTTPSAQWEGFLGEQFANRPRYQFDEVSQEVNRFYGEWLTNRATVKYRPEAGSNVDDAKILNGLYRKDERRNDGQFAIDHGVLEAIQGGYGAFRLSAELEDEDDEENNLQHIIFDPLVSAHSMVVWDPNSKRYDKSDAKWCIILTEMDRDSAEDEFGVEISSFATPNDRREFNWSNKKGSIFIAERYGLEKKKTKVFVYRHPVTGEEVEYLKDELQEKGVIDDIADQGYEKIKERKKTIRTVEKAVFSGNTILEEPHKIAGKNIPVIPIYAYWTYTDGEEFFYGMVRKRKDAQRLLNMQVSSLAEIAATSVKQVPIFTPKQVSGHENNWAQAHLGKKNYQLLNPLTDAQGTVIQTGPIGMVSPPVVDPALAALVEVTRGYIQQQAGGVPQDVVDPNASGKAILAMQERVNMNTQSIMKNIQRSLKRAGEIYRSMAEDIYDTPRAITLTGEDDVDFDALLFKLVVDEETGELVEINDVSKGKYETVVDTGPAYSSKRQQTAEEIRGLMSILPPDSPYTAPLLAVLVENIDGTNLDDIKAFNRKLMLTQGLKEPENEEDELVIQQAQQAGQQPTPADELLRATAANEAAKAKRTQTQSLSDVATARLNTAKALTEEQKVTDSKVKNLSTLLQPMQGGQRLQ